MEMPINFKEFSKDPVKGLLFLVIMAVGYLYVDNKMNYTSQIEKCGVNVEQLNKKVDLLDERLKKSDSTLARAAAKLEMLDQIKGLK
jgi:outer membrane murein-binding lipoprotein Lpp